MNSNLVNNVGSVAQDNLIAKLTPPAEAFGIVLARLSAEATVKRGTLLTRGENLNKYYAMGETHKYSTHQDYTGDGSTVAFVITDKPAAADLVSVSVDGTVKTITTDYTYTAATGTITFSTAPASTKAVVATYKKADTGVAAAILADDVVVGTSADVSAVAYRSGNFNKAALVIDDDYTLTNADVDNLRKYDIILTDMM